MATSWRRRRRAVLAALLPAVASVAVPTRRTAALAVPTSPEWLRVRRVGDEAVVETAARTYGRGGRSVALVGVVHVAEPAYWAALAATDGAVLFESVVDAALVDGDGRLAAPLAATPAARRAAAGCGLAAQSDALGEAYAASPAWRVADLTAQALAGRSAAAEVGASADVAALAGGGGGARVEERVGAALARLLCAFAPAPELAWAALDYAGRPAAVDGGLAAAAAAAAARAADGGALARLSLLRSLVAGAGDPATRRAGPRGAVVVGERNDVVLAAVDALEGDATVLYGVAHMRDLDAKLRAAGWRRREPSWRRCFAVAAPAEPPAAAVLGPLLLGLLALDGADYVATLLDASHGGALPLAALYALRHGALFYAAKKWVLP